MNCNTTHYRANSSSVPGDPTIESRIYAEDPYRNFLPSIGRLVRYRPPQEGKTQGGIVRNDTGVYEGGEISMFYDPMIAKLCTWGETRGAAIDLQARTLDEFFISGIQHNVPFLQAVMQISRFREGRLTTGFIAEEFPEGFHGIRLADDAEEKLAVIAAFAHTRDSIRAKSLNGRVGGWTPFARDWVVEFDGIGGRQFEVAIDAEDVHPIKVALKGKGGARERSMDVHSDWMPGESVLHAVVGATPMAVQITRDNAGGYKMVHRGASLRALVMRPREAELKKLMPKKVAADTSKFLLCPMPGLVVSINVEVGQDVKSGETLAVVEAMKMENVLRAERDGKISKINAKKGDSLAVDAVILEFA